MVTVMTKIIITVLHLGLQHTKHCGFFFLFLMKENVKNFCHNYTVSCHVTLMLTGMTASNVTEVLNSQIKNAPFP